MTQTTAEADPNPLISLFRQCVARISDGKGRFRGTGFFAAPGQLVTCAHVAHGAQELRVQWQGREALAGGIVGAPPLASVTKPGTYPLPDLAVLTIEDARGWDHPCAALATGRPAVDGSPAALYLAGFTVEHGNATALTGATTEFESLIREGDDEFFKLKRGRVLPGFSGSPLLDLRAGAVTGIVESSRGSKADLGGFAVPASTLTAVFPDLAEENRRFHGSDTRWAKAAEAERTRAADRDGQRARLPLRPPVVGLEPDTDTSPATVLRPRHAFVAYVGRERLLADIASWCEQETAGGGAVQLWFVTGGGGFGKTRLAVEACREAEGRGWTTGLLPPDADERKLETLADWPGRLLIAVDYAETRPALISRLIEELAARPDRPPVRVLLLVRRRSTRADLLTLFNEQHEEQLDALLRRSPLSRLDEVGSEVDRLELFRRAADDFATLPGMPPPEASAVPRLRAVHFDRPLYVLAAAYLWRAAPATDVDALTETGLLRVLLAEHEAGYWNRWDQQRNLGLDPADQRAAVGLATLLTADGDSEALTVTRLIPHHGNEPEARQIAIARWLAQLYPPSASPGQLVIAPLEPDRLGEVLTGDLLREHPDLLAAAADTASDRQLAQALTVVARIASDDRIIRDQLRVLLDQRLGDLLRRSFQATGDELLTASVTATTISQPTDGAVSAADRFPLTLPVWLHPLAATITGIAVDGLRRRADGEPTALGELARVLTNLSVRLGDVGRREEALAVAGEAVDRYRQLAEANAAAYLSGFAASLNNQASRLSEAGRREEALAVSGEAVTIRRQLAEASPPAHLPGLAGSLSNQATFLSDGGRREEALAVSGEAVTIRRQLAEANAAAYLPDLAMSLSNQAKFLSEAGRRGEALAAAGEAVDSYRQLAEASPAAYLPELATSLSSQANGLSEAGRREEALAVSGEAVDRYRQLAEANAAAYLPGLAVSLSNQATFLSDVRRREEALAVSGEAVTIRRQLAEASPAAHLPGLATSLSNQATFLSEAGRREEALAAAGEAVDRYRQLAEASPAAYLPDLAMSLNNQANRLSEMGRREEALAVSGEAVTIRRQLAEASPAAYLPGLATSLSNHATLLSDDGKPDRAEELFDQALGQFTADTPGISHLLMARGRWRAGQDRLPDAIADLTAALRASDDTRDYFTYGQVRQLLRSLRQGDQQASFDQAWQETSGPLPAWLQYLATDQQLTENVVGWVQAPDLPASRAYLLGNADALLTDLAEAALEHLIDANPGADALRGRLQLLRNARALGPDAAYRAQQEENDAQYRVALIIGWLRSQTWRASQDFATANNDALLDPATQATLAAFGHRDLRDPAVRLHRGLLGYAAAAGFDTAYELGADTARQASILHGPAIPADTRLALARLHSGCAADDPEAHFQLATATLLAGNADEAAAALADCDDNAAPYEKRDFTRRLSELAAEHPQLAPLLAELQQILSTDAPPATAADH
jgi:hypothetical protein